MKQKGIAEKTGMLWRLLALQPEDRDKAKCEVKRYMEEVLMPSVFPYDMCDRCDGFDINCEGYEV